MDHVVEFAKEINREMNAVILFSEKECCGNTVTEIYNLAMLTGKLGKTSNGIIALKEKNNAQGLIDMGVSPELGIGGVPIFDRDLHQRLKDKWQVRSIPRPVHSIFELLEEGRTKNMFIFGEDPLGCATNKVKVAGWLTIADFVMVQDYFMTETAKHAHLILPASFPFETGGSYTNTQRVIQMFEKILESKTEQTNCHQLTGILKKFGLNGAETLEDIHLEAMSLLTGNRTNAKHAFIYTPSGNCNRMFNHGCDILNKRFDDEFAAKHR
jgi:predicted molibdopterin-dependent oxidoreductase YjgC